MPIKYWTLLTYLAKGRIPGQLVIQLTDRCNARCPQCGMRVTETYARSRLANDDIKRMLDRAAVQGVKAVSFTGGEPLLYLDDLVDLITYAGSVGIEYIRTGTNGFLFRNHLAEDFEKRVNLIAEKLAQTPLYTFWISIDSAIPHVHEQMRGFPGVVKGIEKALPIFHRHGIYPAANLGINRNLGGFYEQTATTFRSANPEEQTDVFYRQFRDAFRQFYRLIIHMGFTISNTCYPMSIDDQAAQEGLKPVYGATSKEAITSFSAAEKALLFRALADTIPEYRSEIRIFSPLSAIHSLIEQYGDNHRAGYPCRGGVDFFFVDAKDGNTYPCGYRGNENYGRFWNLDLKNIKKQLACTRCDWECFRDPSELFGPFLKGIGVFGHLVDKLHKDRRFVRHWLRDLRYYMACEYFNGRIPTNRERLQRFKPLPDQSAVPYLEPAHPDQG